MMNDPCVDESCNRALILSSYAINQLVSTRFMSPEISVVIPTYQQPALLLKCLDALGRQKLPSTQFEIIVVDEGNTVETANAVSLFDRQMARDDKALTIRYVAQPQRQGMAAARNRGWQEAKGRFIAFTDEDCVPGPDWLSAALSDFQRGAQVLSGRMQVFLPNQPTPLDRTATLLRKAEFMAANCFCRKAVLERVGGFEEAFDIAWREDSDLQFKLIQAGVPISKCPEAVVTHQIRACPWYGLLQDERNNRYDALLYKRHPDLFRERIPTYRQQVLHYYATVLSLLAGVVAVTTGHYAPGLIGWSIWGILCADLIRRHLPQSPLSWTMTRYIVLTALAIPFLSVYWRLYGAVKYKVLYW